MRPSYCSADPKFSAQTSDAALRKRTGSGGMRDFQGNKYVCRQPLCSDWLGFSGGVLQAPDLCLSTHRTAHRTTASETSERGHTRQRLTI